MLKALYDWMMGLAAHRRASHALFWVSFAESSFFPIPPDVMLIPMVVAKRVKAWFYASIATIGSVLGGIAGYAIGYFFFETIGRPIVEFYGKTDSFDTFAQWLTDYGFWIVIIAAFTPIPYKVVTISTGVAQVAILPFVIGSILGRGARFFIVAALLYWFGPPIRAFVEKRLGLVTTVFTILLVGGFLALRYAH